VVGREEKELNGANENDQIRSEQSSRENQGEQMSYELQSSTEKRKKLVEGGQK